jgi:hypothetical protein
MKAGRAKYLAFLVLTLIFFEASAQSKKINYHPCFLKDSIDNRLTFIAQYAGRIFIDSFDCKEALLDSIAVGYERTKDVKYLNTLASIRQNPYAKADELYTDVIRQLIESDFMDFVDKLYLARGGLLPLQNELISTMNVIINGRPFKQKYMGLLNVEIERAKDSKDKYREQYLEKLKLKIDEEKYH